mgnify:CR=1 FL=1
MSVKKKILTNPLDRHFTLRYFAEERERKRERISL